jgi:hypothetical protein
MYCQYTFFYDIEKYYHVLIEASDCESERAASMVTKHEKITKEVFPEETSLS